MDRRNALGELDQRATKFVVVVLLLGVALLVATSLIVVLTANVS
jgi:hypothetical protein